MRIEKKFFSISEKKAAGILEELQKTDLDIQLVMEQQMKSDFQDLLAKCREKEARTEKVPNLQKQKAFEALSMKAVTYAENLRLDILIQSDDTTGTIHLTSDCLFLMDHEARTSFMELIKEADDVQITGENNLFHAIFFYQLYDEKFVWIEQV